MSVGFPATTTSSWRRLLLSICGGIVWVVSIAATAQPGLATPPFPPHQGADAKLAAARRAVLDGRVQEALEQLERLARERPESAEVALWLGHALRRSGDPEAAAQQYLEALRLGPGNAGAAMALGDMQDEAGNLTRALDYYTQAIRAAPNSPLGYRKAAGVEVQRLLHSAAIARLSRYLELRPRDAVAMAVLGMERYLDEDIDGAVATQERALALDPGSVRAHFGLGMALADRPGEYDRALHHLEAAVRGDPGNAMALYLIGRIHASRGEHQEALDALQASLALEPAQPDAHYRLALVFARLGDRDSASKHQQRFEELSQARDEQEELNRRIGLLKEAAGLAMAAEDFDQVQKAARELAEIAPDDADVLMVMARMALARGNYPAGLEATRRALADHPDHWEALYMNGILLQQEGRPADARPFLERSVHLNPLYAPSHTTLGNVLMALGEPAQALHAYESAVSLEPDVPAHYLNLASAYRALGKSDLEAGALATHRRLVAKQ